MIISLVVAAASNGAIGKNNNLLWHLPNDLKFFKNTTWAMPVVMGRKTFESIGKPLQGRLNIILSKQNIQFKQATVLESPDKAIEFCKKNNYKELFVIGGGEIYKQFLNIADNIFLTRVDCSIDADAWFHFDASEWNLISATNHKADNKHQYNYAFELWSRKND